MPIVFACECGHLMRVRDESAGRLVLCPACKDRVQVPGDQGVDLGVEVAASPLLMKRKPAKPPRPEPDNVQALAGLVLLLLRTAIALAILFAIAVIASGLLARR